MEEKRSFTKKKKVILILVCAGVVFLAIIGATIIVLANHKPETEKPKNQQETTATSDSTNVQETTIVLETQAIVNYSSSAVNQFSTTAGSEQDEFYENSVFVGDSVMYGFEKYIKARPGTLGDPLFLTSGSFAARIELDPITADSPHPTYNNQKMHLVEALPLTGADKVFLFFGLNDIGMLGVDATVANYQTVINNIKAVCPRMKIYIISTTYMAAGSELRTLNNANIRLLNEKLAANATAWGVGYVDVAKYMYDGAGCMLSSYSSDNYVHINSSAYDLWVGVLRDFASKN